MSGYLSKLKMITKSINQFTDLIPVLGYLEEEEVFVLDGGYLGIGVIAQPTAGVNAMTQKIISSLYKLKYPKGTFVQFILAGLPDIGWMEAGYDQLRGKRYKGLNQTQELADTMSRGVKEYYKDSVYEPLHKKTGQKVCDFENWYMVKMPIKKQIPSKKEMEKALEIKEELISRFDNIGCSPRIMTDKAYLHRMNVLLSVSDNANWRKGEQNTKVDEERPLNKQVIEPGSKVNFNVDDVTIGNTKEAHRNIGVCTFKDMPEHIYYGQALDLVGDWLEGSNSIRENFLLSLHIYLDSEENELKRFNRSRKWTHIGTNGKLGEKFESAKFQRDDFDRINTEMSLENTRIVQAYIQLMIIGNSKKETENEIANIKGYYETKGYSLVREQYIVGPMFLSQLPFGLDEASLKTFDRYQTYTAKTLSFLTPHIANWKGNSSHTVIPLVTRLGQIFSLDLFQTDGSYNCLIAAASGSGKSFFANNIIESYLGSGVIPGGTLQEDTLRQLPEDGAQIFVIDVGRSYEPLAKQYEGSQFIEFGDNMEFSMDPFEQLDDNALDEVDIDLDIKGLTDEEIAEKKKALATKETNSDGSEKGTQIIMIHNILKAMASESGKIDDYQSAMMLHILNDMITELGSKSSVTEFSKRCKDHEDRDVNKIGWQLMPFCETGTYGRAFSKNLPPVNFDSSFIVCELEELKGTPHLQKIVLMCIINAAQHAMFLTGSDRRKLLFLDEAWEFLKDDDSGGQNFFAKFLESGWRRFRKTNAAGVCITQSVMDGYQSQAGIAIVNNSPWKILLRQEPETIDKLETEKAFDGTAVDFKLLKSVHTRKHVYSEMYIRLGSSREICRFYADRRKQLLYSTDAGDKSMIKKYRDTGMTFPQAIDAVVEDERRLVG